MASLYHKKVCSYFFKHVVYNLGKIISETSFTVAQQNFGPAALNISLSWFRY
jgi:hypothetical protein